MSGPLRITTMGCRWEIDISRLDENVAQRLRELWAHAADHDNGTDDADLAVDEPPGLRRELVALHTGAAPTLDSGAGFDPEQVIRLTRDVQRAPYAFSSALTLCCLRAQSGRMTLLHSAALSHPDSGASVVLVAQSGTGKTTATRLLGQELGYLSDETAAIRDDLTLLAHPKPLSLIPESSTPEAGQGKVEQSPVQLGLRPPPPRPWLAATILLVRCAAPTEATLEPVALMDALVDVIPQSSALPVQPESLHTLARVVTAGAGAFRLRYSEIAQAAPLITGLLEQVRQGQQRQERWTRHTSSGAWRTEPWEPSPALTEFDWTPQTRVVRAPWRDALESEGEILVLNGPNPVRLLGLGPTVWRVAATPVTLAELHTAVVAEHGPHPQADDLLRQAVELLAGQGLLQLAD